MKLCRALLLVLLLLSAALVPQAAAQDRETETDQELDGGLGGTDLGENPDPSPEEPAASVDTEVTVEIPGDRGGQVEEVKPISVQLPAAPDFVPDQSPERPHPQANRFDVPCGEWRWIESYLDGTFGLYIPPICAQPLWCGAERVDDHYFGEISGRASRGVYGAFLDAIVAGTAATPGGVIDVDIDGINTSVLASGLGSRPSDAAIATFQYCRDAIGDFDRTTPRWSPRFEWDTSFEAEYDRAAIEDGLFRRVRASLDLYHPDVATVPPLEGGTTWVKFPTWFWITEPMGEVVASSSQDIGNYQITLRASLETVVFTFGDATIACDPDELVAYIADEMDPIDDVGPCHYRPLDLSRRNLSASLTYRIEQRLSHREYSSHPWRHGAWEPHRVNEVTIDRTVGALDVQELLALNVND